MEQTIRRPALFGVSLIFVAPGGLLVFAYTACPSTYNACRLNPLVSTWNGTSTPDGGPVGGSLTTGQSLFACASTLQSPKSTSHGTGASTLRSATCSVGQPDGLSAQYAFKMPSDPAANPTKPVNNAEIK